VEGKEEEEGGGRYREIEAIDSIYSEYFENQWE